MRQPIVKKYNTIFFTAFALAICNGIPTPAAAGENPSYQTNTLETITVTANKQEENIQDVPISVSVFGDVAIEDKNITSIVEIADFIPNFMISGNGLSGLNSPSMRGVYSSPSTFSVSTGMFIDGIPVLSPQQGFETSLLNIERIEVLHGPQGTLYGKNAEAGAINIITRKPGNTFRGKISADGGEDRKKEFSVTMSGPIVQDRLFFNVSGQFYDKDGFIINGNTGKPANDKRNWYGKAALYWNPVDALAIQLSAEILKRDEGGQDLGLSVRGAAAYGLQPSGNRLVYPDFAGTNEGETRSLALKMDYDFSDRLKLSSITTHRQYNDVSTEDYDYNPVRFMHLVEMDGLYQKFSQELRLSSETEQLRWITGVYYDKDDNDFNSYLSSDVPMMNVRTDRNVTNTSYAIFGQLRYALTSILGITGGLRYEKQEGEFADFLTNARYEASWDSLSPKISVDYRFSPEITSYASVAKGFRSGGFNIYAMLPQHRTFDGEELWSYEVGSKTQWLDNRLLINGALFYMNLDQMQVDEAVTPVYIVTTNAAKAKAYGAEVDMSARIGNGFTLTGGFGYTHIEFDEFADALGDYKGNKTPYAPEYTFSIGGQYRMENGIYAGIDFLGYGKMFLDKANQFPRKAYQLVNAKLGYEGENWDVYLYGKNILDKEYSTDGYFGGFFTMYSEPREIGLKLTYRF